VINYLSGVSHGRSAAEDFADVREGRRRASKSKRPSIPICTGDPCFHVVGCVPTAWTPGRRCGYPRWRKFQGLRRLSAASSARTNVCRPELPGSKDRVHHQAKAKLRASHDGWRFAAAAKQGRVVPHFAARNQSSMRMRGRGRIRVAQNRQLWSKIIMTRPRASPCVFQLPATGKPYRRLEHPRRAEKGFCKVIAKHAKQGTLPLSPPTAARSGDSIPGAVGHVVKLDGRLVEGREKTLDRQLHPVAD